jgi:hypothetical protein
MSKTNGAAAIRAALKAQEKFNEDQAKYKAWCAKFDPARKRLDRDIEQTSKRLEQRGLIGLRRRFGMPPLPSKRTDNLIRRFPENNWLKAAVDALGGPTIAAQKIGRNVRTIKKWLREPIGHLSYHKLTPFGIALGLRREIWWTLIGDQVDRETLCGEEAA